jgi:hypothetical protein
VAIIKTSAVVLSPDQLQLYGDVHPDLPGQVLASIDKAREQDFGYAMRALLCGIGGFALVVCLFAYLVMNGHETPAYTLLGGVVTSIILGFIRARLRQQDMSPVEKK